MRSVVGTLPGLIIMNDEKTGTLTTAFKMYESLLCKESLFGNGANIDPAVIMTNNCLELRDSPGMVWSTSSLLLGSFYLLQQVWR